ncbi:MAG: pilus assembly protein PilM [Oscillospiraceae bacterium]|nr:pilus assembly protein PilM [Oscillospiraceae bacterium]MBR6678585.1 pilus assembly protein PilM [Oscillospiraceae bacterium]
MVENRELVYALDIGTRSIVGVVGEPCGGKLKVLAVEVAEHAERSMADGQIDNIRQVAELARTVTGRLEERLGVALKKVCVAAAGRSLQTQKGAFCLEAEEDQVVTQELISRLEAGAVSNAEEGLQKSSDTWRRLFLVGYTVAQYRLDNYPLNNPLDHKGQKVEVDIVATFLPGEVVESLYSAMKMADLQIVSVTLEPIAAMNAAIPAELRLLNLALVDIGAGTTDIAVCRGGSVVGYTMATIAGDEITEAVMRAFLVDFATAETIKRGMKGQSSVRYRDILGFDNEVTAEEFNAAIQEPMERLAEAIAKQVLEVNTMLPSALFLAGGGSKLEGLREKVAGCLGMDERRVAVAGNNFEKSAFSEAVDLENPEYTTPLGIAISAGLGLLNDNYLIKLNGEQAKLFRSGVLTVQDVLLMNGYTYQDMIGRSGRNLSVMLDGRRVTLRGEPAVPAVLAVNGAECPITTLIHAGDEITFIPARHGQDARKTLRELLGGQPAYGRVLLNNQEADLDRQLETNDVILTLEKAAPVSKSAEVRVEEPVAEKAETAEAKASEEGAVVQVRKEGEPLELTLNNETLVLSPKEDGQPYYLMDLLQLSGIDFEHLDRLVKLEVNGEEQGFRFILSKGDKVDIYCP